MKTSCREDEEGVCELPFNLKIPGFSDTTRVLSPGNGFTEQGLNEMHQKITEHRTSQSQRPLLPDSLSSWWGGVKGLGQVNSTGKGQELKYTTVWSQGLYSRGHKHGYNRVPALRTAGGGEGGDRVN